MMILSLILLLYLDAAAIDALTSPNEWAMFWGWVWLLLLGSFLGVFGGLHALSWSAFRSAWAEPGEKGSLRKAVQLLVGWPSVELAAASVLRLLSGTGLLFGGLSWFLRMAIRQGWFEQWDSKLQLFLALQWFRLAPLGLLAVVGSVVLVALARGGRGSVVHLGLAMGGSLLGWWVLWDALHPLGLAEFWRTVFYLMAWFPTYGCALLWGGAFWWGPSLLSGRRRP